MRASLWLPTCIFISAVVHAVLLTAIAVPRKHATAHGETITVDLVPPEEAPESLQREPEPEAAPTPPGQAAPAPQPQQAENVAPRAPETPQRQQPQQPPAQQQPSQQQAAQPQPQQPSPQRPPPQTPPAWPEPQQAPNVRIGQESLAEQGERLAAMMLLPGPGAGDGSGATEAIEKAGLTRSEEQTLRDHLKSCWKLPNVIGATERHRMIIRISLNKNGTLASEPTLIAAEPPKSAALEVKLLALRDEAMRTIRQCAPYTMMPAEKYREWRVLDIDFSPDKMARS